MGATTMRLLPSCRGGAADRPGPLDGPGCLPGRRHPRVCGPTRRLLSLKAPSLHGSNTSYRRHHHPHPIVKPSRSSSEGTTRLRSMLWWKEGPDDEGLGKTTKARIRGAAQEQIQEIQRLENSTRLVPPSAEDSGGADGAAGGSSRESFIGGGSFQAQSLLLEVLSEATAEVQDAMGLTGARDDSKGGAIKNKDQKRAYVERLDRVRYKLSRAIWTSFTGQYYLLLFAVAVISVIGGILWAQATGEDIIDGIWSANSFMLDAGTYAGVEGGPVARLIALSLTIIGLLLVSVLVGIVSEAVETQVEKATQQPDVVLETGHLVVLNWNATVPRLVQELSYGILDSDPDMRNETVVVLASSNQKMMLQRCREVSSSAEVLCVQGSPQLLSNLENISACSARGVVILAEDGVDQEESDASAICTMLTLTKAAATAGADLPTVVMEVSSRDTQQLVLRTFGGKVVPVLAGALAAKMTVQAIIMPGITSVFGELLSFRGSEFYFLPVPPGLGGIKYCYINKLVNRAILVGIQRGDELCLLPPKGLVVSEGDQLVLLELRKGYATLDDPTDLDVDGDSGTLESISSFSDIINLSYDSFDEDQLKAMGLLSEIEMAGRDGSNADSPNWFESWLSTMSLSIEERNRGNGSSPLLASLQASMQEDMAEGGGEKALPHSKEVMQVEGPMLICGWRPGMAILLKFLDKAMRFGSEVHILSEVPEDKRDALLLADGLDMDYIQNIRLVHFEGRAGSIRDLRQLPVIARNGYTAAVLLASRTEEQGEGVTTLSDTSDAMQVKSTLLLRDYFKKCSEASGIELQDTYFVTEVRGTNTDSCVPVSEFVEIGALDAQAISQLIFQPNMHRLLKRLIDGSQDVVLAMEQSLIYGEPGETVSFQELSERVRTVSKTQSLLIGIKYLGQRPVLNPVDQVFECRPDLKLVIMTRTGANAKSLRFEFADSSGSFDEEDDFSGSYEAKLF